MLEILAKLSEITKEDIPTGADEQREYALKLVNGAKVGLAQYTRQLAQQDLETHLFINDVQSEVIKIAFQFLQLNLSKRFNIQHNKVWEPNEQTKKAKNVGYAPGEKKVSRKKKTTTSGTPFETRGKSQGDRMIIAIAKGLMRTYNHLPEEEAIKAAMQEATAQAAKIMGVKK
jgi:5-deoxy-D-glucuronate isomerase